MNLEAKLKETKDRYDFSKKLRNFFYIATGATGLSLISVPYVYQTLTNLYDKETASAGILVEGLAVSGIAMIFNGLYKTYSNKTKNAGKIIAKLQK
jgi:hypothetical protein